jgi:hypothetical protein
VHLKERRGEHLAEDMWINFKITKPKQELCQRISIGQTVENDLFPQKQTASLMDFFQ